MDAPTPVAIDPSTIETAVQELIENAHLYGDVVSALAERKKNPSNPMALIKLMAVGQRAVHIAQDVAPSIQQVLGAFKAGTDTSEFKLASNTSRVFMIIAFLAPAIDGLVATLQHTPFGSSMWVSALAIVAKSAISMNYTDSRTALKKTQTCVDATK